MKKSIAENFMDGIGDMVERCNMNRQSFIATSKTSMIWLTGFLYRVFADIRRSFHRPAGTNRKCVGFMKTTPYTNALQGAKLFLWYFHEVMHPRMVHFSDIYAE